MLESQDKSALPVQIFLETWGVSIDLARDIFRKEPVVLALDHSIKITQEYYVPQDRTRQEALGKVLAKIEILIPG